MEKRGLSGRDKVGDLLGDPFGVLMGNGKDRRGIFVARGLQGANINFGKLSDDAKASIGVDPNNDPDVFSLLTEGTSVRMALKSLGFTDEAIEEMVHINIQERIRLS